MALAKTIDNGTCTRTCQAVQRTVRVNNAGVAELP